MYLKLQKYYDQLGFGNFAGFFFKEALPVIEEYLRTGNMDKGNLRIIDLACGTGILCRLFGNRGYSICGLDMSRAMLIQARRRNPRMRFYKKDLRKFSLKAKFHVATCSFDSLNHLLTYEELRAAFKNIDGVLEKTGVFIFDMTGAIYWLIPNLIILSFVTEIMMRAGGWLRLLLKLS
jgi:SAM-dependent methyltransferase